MWQLLEESCLLLASVSHFGMGGIKFESLVVFPLSLASAFIFTVLWDWLSLHSSQGPPIFLFQWLQGKIFVASLSPLWSWRRLLYLPCSYLYSAYDIDLKKRFFSSEHHLPCSWVCAKWLCLTHPFLASLPVPGIGCLTAGITEVHLEVSHQHCGAVPMPQAPCLPLANFGLPNLETSWHAAPVMLLGQGSSFGSSWPCIGMMQRVILHNCSFLLFAALL